MILKKHNSLFITSICNKSNKEIETIVDLYINSLQATPEHKERLLHDSTQTIDMLKQAKRMSEYNSKIIIINRFDITIMKTIEIDEEYIDNRHYANGLLKTSRAFKISFQNFINDLNRLDVDVMHRIAHDSQINAINETREVFPISWYYKLYKEEGKFCQELHNLMYDYYKYQNPNDYDIPKLNTHLYRNWEDGVDSVDGEIDFLSPLFKSAICDDTGTEFLIPARTCFLSFYQDYCIGQYNEHLDRFLTNQVFDDDYVYCELCDDPIHMDDTYYNETDEESQCESCYDRRQGEIDESRMSLVLHSYSYKPTPNFYYHDSKLNTLKYSNDSKNNLYFGLELEIESRENYTDNYYHVNEISKWYKGLFYCKEDSSIEDINGGFEIVSHPITFNAIKNLDLKNTLCKLSDDYKSFYSRNCGMHIHISRSKFNDLQLYKFVLMLNTYKKLVHLVSQRRRINEYRSWCQFSDEISNNVKADAVRNIKAQKESRTSTSWDGNKRKLKLKFQSDVKTGFRYQVVNLQNSQTIEVRSFKGNLRYEGFMKNIEFVHSMFYFCKEASLQDLNVESYIKYVGNDSKSYNNLNAFFKSNEKALNEIIKNPIGELD